MFQRSVNHDAEFLTILALATLGQHFLSISGAEPGRIALGFLRGLQLIYFQQKSFYDKLLDPGRFPEDALGMNVEMEVPRLDRSYGAGLFQCLALGSVAVRDL